MKTLLAMVLLMTACGASANQRMASQATATAPVKRAPINSAAVHEFETGLQAFHLGGPEAAAKADARFAAAIQIDRGLWEAWHDRGVAAERSGDDDAAVTDFTNALAGNPRHAPSMLGRAEAERRAGKRKEARADYEAALHTLTEDDPLRRDASTRLASLLRDGGNYDDAVEVLRETLRVSGASAAVYTELGLVYLAQSRLELADLVLSKALEIDKKAPAAYNARALLELKQGNAQGAFEDFDTAAALDPNYVDARFNKATVLLDAGDYARAKAELTVVLEKRNDDLDAHVSLGVALRGLKDFPAAKAAWERVVTTAATHSRVRADALFNLALLKADFLEDVAGGKADLVRFLSDAPGDHPKHQAALDKQKELGK